jgi:uncharacterized membrane protein (DUF4010 family)
VDSVTLNALSLALGLGLLIGLQRERAGARFGGIRTFPLVALFGAVCGLLAGVWGYAIPAAGMIAISVLVVLPRLENKSAAREVVGQTSEVAALLTYALGVLLSTAHYGAALVVGGVTAVLLYLKEPMHQFAGRIAEEDLRAVMRFVIITLIILPVLPNEAYGPYHVINPWEIWLMVVLIVGIGLTGYVSYKLFKSRAGTVVNGILGGLISSTATTVAYARRAATASAASSAAVVIGIAWTVSLTRVIIEVVIVAPTLARDVLPPLVLLLAAMVAGCAVMWLFARSDGDEMPSQHNPAELSGALVFGLVYGAVIFATAAVRDLFGDQAVYALAMVSGVVDVDAITLSTARLGASELLDAATTWKVVMLASLTNLVFKGGALVALGSRALFLRTLPVFGLTLGAGLLIIFAWPA